MSIASEQYAALIVKIDQFKYLSKESYIEQNLKSTTLIIQWISYLMVNKSNDIVDHLLDGFLSSIKEVSACLSIGYVRPALASIRSQIELGLAWLFYNDHHVEWAAVVENPSKFRMRAENFKYLKDNNNRFEDRFKMLEKNSYRKIKDPYSLLSTFAHCTTVAATPKIQNLSDVVSSAARANEAAEIQGDVAEFMSDVFGSWFASEWHDLPQGVREGVSNRLSADELKKFVTS